ncbi:similar to ABC transporter [Botrytis cinerea T4]|uniref:Similar to ABC transporter n=1 Tax=Botryotinia fuckeliana (strain T4) TaxID=999810 RepID=G2YL40_BOTF4|nr:similar to ABC transporter [Botrytis cinerea T4]
MDNSGYSKLKEPPITPPSRVHAAYPREKHQKVECAPQPSDPFQDSSLPRPSFAEQRFELPSTLLSPLKPPETSDQFKNPFLNLLPNSPLNPRSSNFNPEEWITNLVAFMGQDPRRYPRRSAGFSFENLTVYTYRKPTDYQKNVANVVLELGAFARWLVGSGKQKVQILKGFDGLIEHGEMLLVLGRPGSGVSSFLKTISGNTRGLFVEPDSDINYQGVSVSEMHTRFRGEVIYLAEFDSHFPNLTVGQTLLFAAKARAPRDFTFPGVTRKVYAEHMRDVMMKTLGLSHVENVLVGDDSVKGISRAERKRVSIAEAALSGCTLQCWDNCTRGFDNTHALEFCKTIRLSTTLGRTTACVALYQVPQMAYDVLYEGRQIYFGPCHEAKSFFIDMGFVCPPYQTTADFLTSLTNPDERIIQPGFEFRVPRTPEEFVMVWKTSRHYARLMQELEAYENEFPFDGTHALDFAAARRSQQAKYLRGKSVYKLCPRQQVVLCIVRGLQRLRSDINRIILDLVIKTFMALAVGVVFYDMPDDTSSMNNRNSLEVLQLPDQRLVVEKQARYAFVHPVAEAFASIVCSIPIKFCSNVLFNAILYFMASLRRTTMAFFTFIVFSFVLSLTLSMAFRTIGASCRSHAQASFSTAVVILAFMMYAGFVVPRMKMAPWLGWIAYVNPVACAYESLIINEFSGQIFPCGNLVPSGPPYISTSPHNRVCAVVGAISGFENVLGTIYLELRFGLQPNHLWREGKTRSRYQAANASRNMSILFAFMAFFMAAYLLVMTHISMEKMNGEILLFQRGHKPLHKRQKHLEIYSSTDAHRYGGNGDPITKIQRQTSTFQWKDICLDIKTRDGTRRILDHVDGWVKPGTLTALMGPTGAGKTSLLDVLASRSNVGVVSGESFVDGCIKDISFQRKVGYIQQEDFHLATMTVREALQFSAIMRQSGKTTKKEKIAYVEEMIKLLEMDVYADAIIGVPGLNIEQRKKLTIGIELVAKPKLLLFLDEPTTGLDSSTSWEIIELLKKMTAHGQAVLCTIHQPSTALFRRFDSLLFLGPGGRPLYFGRLGENCETVKRYFESNGADPCPLGGNVVEWIMHSTNLINWPEVWRNSHELVLVHRKLDHMRKALVARSSFFLTGTKKPPHRKEFATTFIVQVWQCFRRTTLHYWRTPSYIYSKIGLSLFYALFIGFSSFRDASSLQDLQNQTFNVFMLLTLASTFVAQILPNALVQRALFEARERPAKIYSWPAFIISNILVELPWNTLSAIIVFLCWYYPVGMYRNAISTKSILERNGVMVLLIWIYLIYASTFGYMVQVGLELTMMAGNLSNAAFFLSLMFCGIISAPIALSQIWRIVWRLSPFTYLVDGMLSIGLGNVPVTCSQFESLHFEPVTGGTCGSYMASYIQKAGGYLTNPSAKTRCVYCPLKDSNEFLAAAGMSYTNRWRNFCIMWAYVGFNVVMTLFIYWLVRVPKNWKGKAKENLDGSLGARNELVSEPSEPSGASHSERSFVKVSGYKEESPQTKKRGRSDDIELVQM